MNFNPFVFKISLYNLIRPLVKSAYQKINFLISKPKHMLWGLKRTVSLSTQNMLKRMCKKIFTILRPKLCLSKPMVNHL